MWNILHLLGWNMCYELALQLTILMPFAHFCVIISSIARWCFVGVVHYIMYYVLCLARAA